VRTVVLDTNVLLSDPEVVHDFGDDEVLIPDTVLGEIDKLKTARVDPELRYRGRALSRMLFGLAEGGDLSKGVALPTGGTLRVAGVRDEKDMPEGLSARNADDKILAVALQACTEGCEDVVLVTNDLNMMIKAQAQGLEVRRAEVDDDTFTRRYIVRPFQRYRVPLTILAVAIAVFAAIVYLVAFSPLTSNRTSAGISSVPPEFLDQLTLDQQQVLNYLFRLQASPKDVDTERNLAILYDNMASQNAAYTPYAIKHWEAVLKLAPNDTNARTDLATDYFKAGQLEKAVAEVTRVLQQEPDHVNANFNLAVFYMSMKPKQFQKAANQLEKVIRLTAGNTQLADTNRGAQAMLKQVIAEAKAAGTPVQVTGGTL
jgi:hypothetical protein